MSINGDITQLLRAAREGDESAVTQVWERLYGDLKAIAGNLMKHQRGAHTLSPTAVVNEAYVRLCKNSVLEAADRRHFLALAAKAMRALLVDHARRKSSDKRGGDLTRVVLDDETPASPALREPEVLDLHRSLERLAVFDEKLASLVELRYFGGLSIQEVADCIEVGVTKVKEDWSFARAWLSREMGQPAQS